jgi:TolA-binding protein
MTRSPLTEEQLTSAFRTLADDHVRRRESSSAEQSWQLIRARQQRAALTPPRSRFGFFAFAAALSLAAAGAAVAIGWSNSTLDYEVLGGIVEDRVIRTDSRPATLSFSDDSYIQVEPNSTVSVAVVGPHKAVTRLASGKLHVKVKHDAGTDWRFLAGPYELRVIGTSFELAWEPSAERLSVVMYEGELLVTSPKDGTRSLRAGEKLLIEKPVAVAERAEPKPELAPEPVLPTTPPGKAEATASKAPPANSLSWSQLVAKGRFDEVVQAAEAMGIDTALQRRDAADLHALAQAARYAGHGELALRTWQAMRQRFAGQSVASQAAFFLGRSFDEQGQATLALKWLDVYLAEAPSGVYAADALGRKLSLVQRREGTERAKAVAREYLKRFPNGSYAKTARDMLERE